MIHNENLRSGADLYEIRHDNSGNAIHVYIKDGEAIVFPTVHDLVSHVIMAVPNVERFYKMEEDLEEMYVSDEYEYYALKKIYGQ